MATFVQKDFEWVRGTTPRVAFEFKTKKVMGDGSVVSEPLVFDDCRFTVWKGRKNGNILFRYSIASSEITLTDPALGRVEWMIQAEHTRMLQESPIGEDGKNRYEIELRNGELEHVYIMGFIAGIGGINDDEADIGGTP